MDTFRILVTGTRVNRPHINAFVCQALDSLTLYGQVQQGQRVIIVHGDCPDGVDQYAKMWAIRRRLEQEPYPADWRNYGKAAGPRRNAAMVATRPDYCLGFPAAGSKGTWDCLQKAVDAGIPTKVHVIGPMLIRDAR